jgi:hypothetical protein
MLISRTALIVALTISSAFAQTITVYSSGSVPVGQTRQLTAYVPLSPNTVTWSVNGVAGGNTTYGTVSSGGLYSAPMAVPANNAVIVQATSTAFPAKFGTVTMTVTQPPVQLWSISPTSVPAGSFTISLNGSNFGPNSVVKFGTTSLSTTLLSSTGLRASGVASASQAGTRVPITVTNTGLGGTTSSVVNLTITATLPVTVTVSPSSASVTASSTRQFTAAVAGSSNTAVTWSVNGMTGGNSTNGTISATGLYTAPASVPSPASVTIRATSTASTSAFGAATVTIQPPAPPPVSVAVAPASVTVAPSATQQFSATVTGSSNTAVTWSVNGTAGGSAATGTISATGLYTAPAVPPAPAAVTVRAASVASPASGANATVNVVGPPDPGTGSGTGNLSAARFLEQAAFGPTPSELAHLKQIGIDAWLTEQFAAPETPIPNPGAMNSGAVKSEYLSRLSVAPDQLRQRVAAALSQIIVISMNKNIYPDEVVPYLQILSRNAFGNYRMLLGEISVSSQMGKYLDLARSTKPGPNGGANENYAREVMQLFSIGVYKLNLDGSQQLDAQGKPIPAYDQTTVQQVALALTGWVYKNNAWEDFSGPLQPNEANHDLRAKTFLGCTLPAGQSTTQDMNGFLDCLFTHPNVAPFISTRLIRSMVSSNPSPAYIQRVATVFNNNGQGVRGDLKAVVTAILKDPEARNDAATPSSGRLKDPIFHIVSFARALGGGISSANGLPWLFSRMGQEPLTPPSVFSFYGPAYHVPKSPLFGPEFQIYTPTESVLRGNFLWGILSNPASDFTTSLSPFLALAGNPPQLIDAIDQALLYGRMPQPMRQSLATAMAAQSDNTSRTQTALYLTALSGLYAVQY